VHPKHELHYLHGWVNPTLAHSQKMQEAIESLVIPRRVAEYFDYYRPLPEPSTITSTSPYSRLKDIFSAVSCICIVGYSFGAWGGRLDDTESFELLTDLLRWEPKPVLVVNPAPHCLVALLEAAIKRKTVYALCCKWNILARFIMSGCFLRAWQMSPGSTEFITRAYLSFEDNKSGESEVTGGAHAHRACLR